MNAYKKLFKYVNLVLCIVKSEMWFPNLFNKMGKIHII